MLTRRAVMRRTLGAAAGLALPLPVTGAAEAFVRHPRGRAASVLP